MFCTTLFGRPTGTNDFGWQFFVNNPLEDTDKPVYIQDSMTITKTAGTVEGNVVQWVSVSWLFADASPMDGCYTRLIDDSTKTHSTSGLQEHTKNPHHPDSVITKLGPGQGQGCTSAAKSTSVGGADLICYRATIKLMLTEFRATANYTASQITMKDAAGQCSLKMPGVGCCCTARRCWTCNAGAWCVLALVFVLILHPPNGTLHATGNQMAVDPPPVWLHVQTTDFDVTAPEVDLDAITVGAEPTHPASPNGETLVNITYVARDDKSGIGKVSYRLLDPLGGSHFEYHYHANFHTKFFAGDSTAWMDYRINVVLPKGSPPGTWGQFS